MNLHAIAGPAIAVINPYIFGDVWVSSGYTTQDDGVRVPTFTVVSNVQMQCQPLQYSDIQLIDGLQLNGERRAFYMNGRFDSLNRPEGTGGDLIKFGSGSTFPYGTEWKIAVVAEQWPDWCKVIATMQNP